MKQLTCEMCGSTDLIKKDGVFVCQSCGCKYSVEEAKKMMIEGIVDVSGSTVKVDRSENVAALLERAGMALEDEEWKKASYYSEQILDLEPKNADAYLVKLMSALGVKYKKDLAHCKEPFDGDKNYKKIMSFGSEQLREELCGYVSLIKERNDLSNKAFEQKVELVVEAFRKAQEKNDSSSKEAVINRKKARLTELSVILEGFDAFNQEVIKKQEALADIEGSIEQLSSRRDNLGLFAGREKKHIDEQLIALGAQKESITQEINHMHMQHNTGGYTEKSKIEHDISVLESFIQGLEEEVRKDDSKKPIMSIEEAIWLYATNHSITKKVDEVLKFSQTVGPCTDLERRLSYWGYNADEMDKMLADRFADSDYPIGIEDWELESFISSRRLLRDFHMVMVSELQRRFRIGYNTAIDLLETLIKRGIIGAVTHKLL